MSILTSNDWQNIVLQEDRPIAEAITNLERTGAQIILIIDSNFVLKGTVTDGDIRRAIISGTKIDEAISKCMNISPVIFYEESNKQEVLKKSLNAGIRCVPKVDSQNKLVGIFLPHEEIHTKLPNRVFIMAGGKGVRLQPHTNELPKPMLSVLGKPILQHIIEHAKNQGFYKFTISVNYLSYIIENYFKDGQEFGVEIEYINEQLPLGTAGALKLLNPNLKLPILITNGDVITNLNFVEILEFHKRENAAATMAVKSHEYKLPYGIVKVEKNEITEYYEKPTFKNLINAGIYVLNPEVISLLKDTEKTDMPTLFQLAKESNMKTQVFKISTEWMDIGRIEDLNLANLRIQNYD